MVIVEDDCCLSEAIVSDVATVVTSWVAFDGDLVLWVISIAGEKTVLLVCSRQFGLSERISDRVNQ